MKKLYVLSFALLFGASTQAQIIDFESYSLASESFDNDAGASEFVLSNGADIHFFNDYNPGGWFTGFAISNTTDVTTPGLPNQYSAWTGGGANGSTVYAIRYGGGAITTPAANVSFDSIKITNTTYAALSMRDGDAIAKQFGSSTNAAGDDDGTNGEDYFRLWIIGTSADGMTSDSIEFYLADYRFSDPTQDYIVDEWVNIDFSSFTFDVNSIDFRLESTDNHPQWGMNTPNYFAIDDVAFSIASGIPTEELSNVQTYPNPVSDYLTVAGESGTLVLTDLAGAVVLEQDHKGLSKLNVSTLNAGIYVITLTNASGKYTNRIVVK